MSSLRQGSSFHLHWYKTGSMCWSKLGLVCGPSLFQMVWSNPIENKKKHKTVKVRLGLTNTSPLLMGGMELTLSLSLFVTDI